MRFKIVLAAATIVVGGHANAALFSETTAALPETGEFSSDFEFASFDESLGIPTEIQVSFNGYLQPKVTNTGLAPSVIITIEPMMSVEFYGPISEPTIQGAKLTIPVDLAGAGIVGGQSFSANYDLPLSFLGSPGGILSGFAEVLGSSGTVVFFDGDTIDGSNYGGSFTLNVTYDPIDEPTSPLLMGSGLFGLAALRIAGARVTRPGRS